MNFALARRNMVDCQMLPNKITDTRIIDIMGMLPREDFLPEGKKNFGYADKAISIGADRFILEPLVTARMLQSLKLRSSDVALSIGCGAGYAVAVLAKMVNTVVALEINQNFIKESVKNFLNNDIDNIIVVEGELREGYSKQAPYDVIFFDGGVSEIPVNIKSQLAEEGRAIAVVVQNHNIGTLSLFKKFHGTVSKIDLQEITVPLLPGFGAATKFCL